jgi:hypothetical protein
MNVYDEMKCLGSGSIGTFVKVLTVPVSGKSGSAKFYTNTKIL